jgi:hypothetical protein
VVDLSDEHRHFSSANERWSFDVAETDWALHCSLALTPLSAAWWMLLARPGQPLLLVREDTLDLPRRTTLEVRGSGVWVDVHCHEPMQRWQVNFEGIALSLDASAVGRHEVGDLVPVEFEFEWDALAPPTTTPFGYVQRCMVDGEAQIGTGSLAMAAPAPGWRGHSW